MATNKRRRKRIKIPGFFTCDQAAKKGRMKPDTVRRYVNRGLIKTGLVGDVHVISEEEFDRFLAERRDKGRPSAKKLTG